MPLIDIKEIAQNPVYIENLHLFGYSERGIGSRVQSDNVLIEDCLFDNFWDGVNISSCSSIKVLHNTFENIGEYAIRGGAVRESHFEGNRVKLCVFGMLFQSGSDHNSIKNNIISNFSLAGIGLRESNQTTISGNTVCDDHNVNTGSLILGIYLMVRSGYNILSGNVVCNVTNAGAGTGYGIAALDPDCINNPVSGNMACGSEDNINFVPGNTVVDNVEG